MATWSSSHFMFLVDNFTSTISTSEQDQNLYLEEEEDSK